MTIGMQVGLALWHSSMFTFNVQRSTLSWVQDDLGDHQVDRLSFGRT
jgi:hypothetical protein